MLAFNSKGKRRKFKRYPGILKNGTVGRKPKRRRCVVFGISKGY
jgi:hypothetical protein